MSRKFIPRPMVEAPVLPDAQPRAVQKRHALLLNPFYPKDPIASFGKHVLTPTLALTSIAGATPKGWELSYHDENLLQGLPPCDPLPEVVGISVHLTFAKRAYELARWYRAMGSKVILGGLHVVSCPEEAKVHADAVAIGDGVALWPQMLHDIERGQLQCEYRADFTRPYRDDPPPRRDLLPKASFLTTTSVIATRGCHNRCGFCYLSTDGLRMPYRMRDVQQVVDEIAADGQPYCVFVDNNLGSKKEYLRDLCRALRPLGIIWSAAVTIDVTDDPSLVREMALSGCTGVFIGYESLGLDNLVQARKKTPAPEDYLRRTRVLHDNGIQVNGSFVLGFDHDGPDIFERTVNWVEEAKLECATFHIMTPYPGTPLFRQMESEGRLLHRDWSRYDTAHCVFQPRHMTPEQLEAGYQWCYKTLFSHGSIWRRRPEDWSAVPSYLAASYLYKRANPLWYALIRQRWVNRMWSPLITLNRDRHLKFRKRLETQSDVGVCRADSVVTAGV